MGNAFEGLIIILLVLSMSFLAIVAIFAVVLVFSTIPRRHRD